MTKPIRIFSTSERELIIESMNNIEWRESLFAGLGMRDGLVRLFLLDLCGLPPWWIRQWHKTHYD